MKFTQHLLDIFLPLPQSISAAQVATQLTQLGHECEPFLQMHFVRFYWFQQV
jgi:hypothetical protein